MTDTADDLAVRVEPTDLLQPALDAALARVSASAPASADAARLADALREATYGGKRFRPRLVALVHDGLAGSTHRAVPAVAAAVELLHTALVVHDDVIDGDDTRRGRHSVPGRFRAEAAGAGADARAADTYAVAGAVLTGDLALTAAIRTIASAPVPALVLERLLGLVDRALATSAAGELADVRLAAQTRPAALSEALAMAEHKTAAYSFELPMTAGAVLAGASAATVDGLGRIGRLLGTAFQLRDDLLGVFGDPAVTGKSDLADLREGKCTPLVAHAQTTSAWPRVAAHWGDPHITVAEAATVRGALEDAGSRAFVEALADELVDAATVRAADLGLPTGLVAAVQDLCRPVPRGAA
jgi:geranylgeranyl pyrophosphate synthase